MTAIPIVCDNCGAKYKLPETFSGPQAKCQKCGSAIDVARQRGGAADAVPAAARPAGARPAVDRSKEPPRAAERAPAIAAVRSARDERGRTGGARRGRAGARDGKPAKSKLPWIVVAAIVVGGVIVFAATR